MWQFWKSQSANLNDSKTQKKLILLTGSVGRIGRYLRKELEEDYQFRCVDRKLSLSTKNFRSFDIMNFKALLKEMQGVDAVIHLAINSSVDQPWRDTYTTGIGGTYNVFEAARQAGVKKIIYASTNHVSGWRDVLKESNITTEQPVRPDSLYAVGKCFGENLGKYFCDRYGMSIICLRIGWFEYEQKISSATADLLKMWCSPRDLLQMVRRSLEAENLGFQIFYAVSDNTTRVHDISNAQQILKYKPQDNSQNFLN